MHRNWTRSHLQKSWLFWRRYCAFAAYTLAQQQSRGTALSAARSQRVLSRCWKRWKVRLVTQKNHRYSIARVFRIYTHSQVHTLRSAFFVWKCEAQLASTVLAVASHTYRYKRGLARRALLHFMKRNLFSAFSTWRSYSAEAAVAAMHAEYGEVMERSFNSTQEQKASTYEMRKQFQLLHLQDILTKWATMRQRSVWKTWCSACVYERQQEAAVHKINRSFNRILRACLASYFHHTPYKCNAFAISRYFFETRPRAFSRKEGSDS